MRAPEYVKERDERHWYREGEGEGSTRDRWVEGGKDTRFCWLSQLYESLLKINLLYNAHLTVCIRA